MKKTVLGSKKYFFLIGQGPPDRDAEIETIQNGLPLPEHHCFDLSEEGLGKFCHVFETVSKNDDIAICILAHGNATELGDVNGKSMPYVRLLDILAPLRDRNDFTLVPCNCQAPTLVELAEKRGLRCFCPATDIEGKTRSGPDSSGEVTVNAPLMQFLSKDLQGKDNRARLCKHYRELRAQTEPLGKSELDSLYAECALATGVTVAELTDLSNVEEKVNNYPGTWVLILVVILIAVGVYLLLKSRKKR